MLYFWYVKQKKQNTFRVHRLWFVFVFSWLIIKERGQGIVTSSYSQKKSCCKNGNGFRNFVIEGYHQQGERKFQNT